MTDNTHSGTDASIDNKSLASHMTMRDNRKVPALASDNETVQSRADAYSMRSAECKSTKTSLNPKANKYDGLDADPQ